MPKRVATARLDMKRSPGRYCPSRRRARRRCFTSFTLSVRLRGMKFVPLSRAQRAHGRAEFNRGLSYQFGVTCARLFWHRGIGRPKFLIVDATALSCKVIVIVGGTTGMGLSGAYACVNAG